MKIPVVEKSKKIKEFKNELKLLLKKYGIKDYEISMEIAKFHGTFSYVDQNGNIEWSNDINDLR